MTKRGNIYRYIKEGITETVNIFIGECKNIFKDSGVILIFFVAGIAYPLLYNFVYYNESIQDIPVAVVDQSASSDSRRFIRKLEATKEVEVVNCVNMEQAEALMTSRDVHGIVLIPEDFHVKLAHKEQATISAYLNMACFLIYKNVALAVNYVMLDETKQIQVDRYAAGGVTGEKAQQLITAIPYEENTLYNPGNGFTSFFLPALLIVIIHQTLFFGVGMLAGTAREENKNRKLYPAYETMHGIFRIIFGKAAAYIFLYSFLTAYITILVPRIFNLPHLGNPWDIYRIMFPFLLAATFFAMSFAAVIKNRETGMVMFLFFSIILLFLSGFSWPVTNMPAFWKYFSWLFPSTFGVQGYIKINTMGADISQVRFEYIALWIQAGIYFLIACFSMQYVIKKESDIPRSA